MNAAKLERITELLNGQVKDGAAVGCSALVLKNGKPIFRANAGMADSARGIKWEDDTIVRLYSMTKPITSAAAMILLDRGAMDIHDKAEWFLEGFKNQQVLTENGREPVNRAVEIKDLLDMTSGLCYPDRGFPAGDSMSDLLWGIPGWICFGLIFVFGHGLNIALSCLSGYVHSIRLTFVEYFKNSGYDGRGVAYKPFSSVREKE